MLVEPPFSKPTIKDSALSKLDNEMSEILKSKLDDDTKMKIYSSILRRYHEYDKEPVKHIEPLETLEKDVILSTPANLQYKVKRILTQLGQDADVEFTPQGQLIYKQVLIDNSNILDLISDILQKKPSFAPGGKEIAESLVYTKTPKEMVSNPAIATLMKEKKEVKTQVKQERPKRGKKITNWKEYQD